MKMIPHQTKGVNLPAGFGTSLAEGFQKALPILIILENLRAPIPAIHHVINRPRIFHS